METHGRQAVEISHQSVPSGGRAFVWITISGDKSSLPANHWPLVTNYLLFSPAGAVYFHHAARTGQLHWMSRRYAQP